MSQSVDWLADRLTDCCSSQVDYDLTHRQTCSVVMVNRTRQWQAGPTMSQPYGHYTPLGITHRLPVTISC